MNSGLRLYRDFKNYSLYDFITAFFLLASLLVFFLISEPAEAKNSSIPTGPDGIAFYNLPASLKTGKHGDMIWAREIKSGVPHSKAWKILYWSTTQDNQIIPVSGLIIVPENSQLKSDRPIVTWGHGTSGEPRNCAPSLVDNPARDATFYYFPNSAADFDFGVPALSKMIDAGYVVTATDYNGLGAPGIHQYVIGQTEARNMLDAAIAAQQLAQAGAGKQIISIGWSQGGQAAVWTAQIPEYLGNHAKLLGAVALAPVNGLEEIKIIEKMTSAGEKLRPVSGAERLMAWYAMTVAYPELKLSDVLTPLGIKFFAEASKSQCAHHLSDSLTYLEEYQGIAARKDPINQDAWIKRYTENSLGYIPAKTPLAVFQGDEDLAVFPAATQAYVNKACSSGTTISFTLYKGIDHIRLSSQAAPAFLKWMADRFAGKPAPTTCQ